MEILRRIRRALREDFLSIVPGSPYPFTSEAFLRLLYYAGFTLFSVLLILSAIGFNFSERPTQIVPEPSEQILNTEQI